MDTCKKLAYVAREISDLLVLCTETRMKKWKQGQGFVACVYYRSEVSVCSDISGFCSVYDVDMQKKIPG